MTTHPAGPEPQAMPRAERAIAIAIAVVTLAMRVFAYFNYRFDSDEPQHLHVAWGWTAGLLQYRDVFDNHAPLFHITMAPLLRLLGERANILLYMRAPMIIFWLIVSLSTYAIARHLYGSRIAIWSMLLLNVLPTFFLKSLEFRTDNLWNAFWMLAVVALTLGPRSTGVFFLAGLLLGCALSVSLKTSLLLITLAAAGAITYFLSLRERGTSIRPRHLVALAIGLAIVPSLIVGYFVARGAWSDFSYCVFHFNKLVTLNRSPLVVWLPRILYIPLLVITVRVARRYRGTTSARLFFAVATPFFFLTLFGFWILISPRDFLAFMPFVSIFIVAGLARTRYFLESIAVLAIVLLVGVAYYTEWFSNRTREFITMEHQLLTLTKPGDLVMDYKGETIYRARPYRFILEFITRNAIAKGRIADTVPEDLLRTRCHVAQADGNQWPDRAHDFMRANFVDLGRLRASGQWLQSDGTFSIAIPGEYVVLTKRGEAGGTLDGSIYHGARSLAAGVHRFAGGSERMVCLWAPAYARGFSPFHPRDLDF